MIRARILVVVTVAGLMAASALFAQVAGQSEVYYTDASGCHQTGSQEAACRRCIRDNPTMPKGQTKWAYFPNRKDHKCEREPTKPRS